MKEHAKKLFNSIGNIHHVLAAGIISFIISQVGQMPLNKLNRNFGHNIDIAIISLIPLLLAVAWALIMVYKNRQLDTPHDFYNCLVNICWKIALILIGFQAWAHCNILWFHLNTGATTTNQQSINALGATTIGLLFQRFLVIIVGPITEEFLFRYAIIQPKESQNDYQCPNERKHSLKRGTRLIIAILAFAGIHMLAQFLMIQNATQAKAALFGFVQYLIIAAVFSLNYYRRNNIKENIILHMGYNFLATLASL